LAAVVTRQLDPKLLETYEQERRNHAWQMIMLALRMGRVMMPRSRAAAALMQAAFRGLRFCPPARDYFGQMKYKPKPYFRAGFLSREGLPASATKLIGRLFPQPAVTSPAGPVLLDDVLGPGFALVTLPSTPAATFSQLPSEFGASQHIRRVAIVHPGAPAEVPNRVLRVEVPADSVLSALAQLPRGFLLLRPDRYIAAFLPANQLEQARERIERLFAATSEEPRNSIDSSSARHGLLKSIECSSC
jgi:3-(3-hydroxy-phenyl)propionate hydroxylase